MEFNVLGDKGVRKKEGYSRNRFIEFRPCNVCCVINLRKRLSKYQFRIAISHKLKYRHQFYLISKIAYEEHVSEI